MSLRQFLAIILAHRRQALLLTLALLVATVVVVKLLPKSYTAQATVLVNYESNADTRQAPPELFDSYMLTQVQLIQSPAVLLAAIDRLGLTHDPEFTEGFRDNGTATLPEWAEKVLRSKLAVDQGKGIQLLYVSVTSKDRNKAPQIANAIVDTYLNRQSEHSDTPGNDRAREYSAQLADLQARVNAATAKLAAFRQSTGIVDLNNQLNNQNDVETQTLNALEQQLLVAQNEQRTAQAKSLETGSSSDQVLASQLVQNLKAQLATLQAQLSEATITLGPRHPQVIALQSQIDATRRSIAREVGTFSQNSSSDVTGATQLVQQLRQAVARQRAKLVKVRQLQDEGQELQLELDSAQTTYKQALDNYQQVMFASASVVTRATPPLEPSGPSKLLLAAIGALASILIGVGTPLCHELWFNRRVHCRDDVERDLGLPVLAEFEPIIGAPEFM